VTTPVTTPHKFARPQPAKLLPFDAPAFHTHPRRPP